MPRERNISAAVIRRLPRYYRYLGDLMESGVWRISSRELAERMNLTASQIRQDLNCFGEFGQQGFGYAVDRLHSEIGKILGLGRRFGAIIIGAGNLGRAFAQHINFNNAGFELLALFDTDPSLIGRRVSQADVLDARELERFCSEHEVAVAVLCIPSPAAPCVVERLLSCGVDAFWNFTSYDIAVAHPGALVESAHLADELMTLCYRVNDRDCIPEE